MYHEQQLIAAGFHMLINPLICLDAGVIDQALVSLLATCLSRSIDHLEWKWSCADYWTEASSRSLISYLS